jgi:hypothetical protein
MSHGFEVLGGGLEDGAWFGDMLEGELCTFSLFLKCGA